MSKLPNSVHRPTSERQLLETVAATAQATIDEYFDEVASFAKSATLHSSSQMSALVDLRHRAEGAEFVLQALSEASSPADALLTFELKYAHEFDMKDYQYSRAIGQAIRVLRS
jgi:hypothetical protein